MLRFIGVLMMAFVWMGASPLHADDRAFLVPAVRHHPGLAAKWRDAQRRMAQDAARLAACRAEPWMCSETELRFETIVEAARAREGRARIGEINRAVNLAIRPVSDEQLFDAVDYWASPLETVAAGAGDCEDYAILKLMALQEIGVAPHDLQLMIVRDRAGRGAHAVATVRLDGRWLVLDNRNFVMADLAETHYRVLAQLDSAVHRLATLGESDQASRDVM